MLLGILLFSLACGLNARPSKIPSKEYVTEYARKHPNPGVDNPELGDLFQGDIITNGQEMNTQTIMPDERFRWPNNILYYEINTEDFSETQIEEIEFGVQDLMENTNVDGQPCIQLVPRTNEENYVFVVTGGGCSSAMGMTGGRQILTLAAGCFRHGTIMHEFLHALGYYHEQSRADRDDYIFVNYTNIIEGLQFNYDKLEEGTEIDHLGTRYDYGSVMHYPAWGFAIDPDIPTLVPLEDVEIGQREKLSDIDIERVKLGYKCIAPLESKYFKHLAL